MPFLHHAACTPQKHVGRRFSKSRQTYHNATCSLHLSRVMHTPLHTHRTNKHTSVPTITCTLATLATFGASSGTLEPYLVPLSFQNAAAVIDPRSLFFARITFSPISRLRPPIPANAMHCTALHYTLLLPRGVRRRAAKASPRPETHACLLSFYTIVSALAQYLASCMYVCTCYARSSRGTHTAGSLPPIAWRESSPLLHASSPKSSDANGAEPQPSWLRPPAAHRPHPCCLLSSSLPSCPTSLTTASSPSPLVAVPSLASSLLPEGTAAAAPSLASAAAVASSSFTTAVSPSPVLTACVASETSLGVGSKISARLYRLSSS